MSHKGKNNYFYRHGMTGTKFHTTWLGMKQRTLDENASIYHKYGGRGISISMRWIVFEYFRDDMYEVYLEHAKEHGEKNTSIERIDNDGHYMKSNCRWATWEEQRQNKRPKKTQKWFKAISPDGKEYKSMNQQAFSKEHGLNRGHVNNCLNKKPYHHQHKGWTFEYI